MTDEILSELQNRDGGKAVTPHYSAIAIMKHFGLSPGEWQNLTRFDKLMLTYQRVMSGYYERKAIEKQRQEAERAQMRERSMANLPGVRRR